MAEMTIRVVATRDGQYNQIYRDAGEVFDLLLGKNGEYKPLIVRRPERDADGNRTGKIKTHHIIAKDWNGEEVKVGGKPIAEHEDYAEDMGDTTITEGPLAGEVQHVGWMRKVPPTVPCGLYPDTTDFWSGFALPPPNSVRVVGQQHPRAAKILDFKGQTFAPPPAPKVVTVTPAQVSAGA